MRTPRRYPQGSRLARFLLTVAAAAFLMVPAAAAQAHDALEATDPASGSAVAAVPARIGLTFDHTPIAIGSLVRVEDNTGTDQADGPVAIVDNHATQPVKTGAPQGKYTVIWRVVSSDGHAIEGTFTFTAGAAPAAAAAPPPQTPAGTGGGIPGLVTVGALALILVIAVIVLATITKRRLRDPGTGE